MMSEVLPREVAYVLAAVFGGLGVLMWFWRPGPRGWIGVRTPWTYADREIWDRSWNQAAVLLLVIAAAALIHWVLLAVAVALLIIWSIGFPMLLYRRKYGTLRFWKDHGWIDYRPVARCALCGHFQKLASHADLARSACEACGAKLPGPGTGLRA
jgi:hypothetical protein